MKKAFTLVELLIAIIIIIIIIGSLIPVITKKASKSLKIKSETKVINPKGEIFIPFDGHSEAKGDYYQCEKAEGNSLTCAIKNIPSSIINVILVGAGGGGGGASKASFLKNQSFQVHPSTAGVSGRLNIQNISNVTVDLYGAGASGGGGLYKENLSEMISYIDSCPTGSEIIKVGSGKEYCVTKYNLRPQNYDDYHANNADGSKSEETEAAKKEIKVPLTSGSCWITPELYCKNSSGNEYPECGRTTCNWTAAVAMCSQLDLGGNACKDVDGNPVSCKGKWRLPTDIELSAGIGETSSGYIDGIFQNNYSGLNGNAVNALNVCASSGVGYCSSTYTSGKKTCSGSGYNNYCVPYEIWGAKYDSNNAYYASNGSSSYSRSYTYTFTGLSVRCVLEKTVKGNVHYVLHSGGGGSAGAAMVGLKVPQDIIDDCYYNKKNCEFYAQTPYAVTSKSSGVKVIDPSETPDVKAEDGKNGGGSFIQIRSSSNILWGYKVEGGRAGKGATLVAPGQKSEEAVLCYKFDVSKGDWGSGFDCINETEGTGIHGVAGGEGVAVESDSSVEFVPAKGGAGGRNSLYPVFLSWYLPYGTGTAGGSLNSLDSSYDSPGSDNSYYSGSGYVSLKYDVVYRGYSGGGGGGGSFVRMENIFMPSKKYFDVYIGGGGSAGKAQTGTTSATAATNGGDGGSTTIALENNVYYMAPGGKGGTKGVSDTVNGEGESGKGGLSGKVPDKLIKEGEGSLIANGIDGKDGYLLESGNNTEINPIFTAVGGLGGRSGISVSQNILEYASGCGGFFIDTSIKCENQQKANAMNNDYLFSNIPGFDAKNNYYGSYGAGGGGGGWNYDTGLGTSSTGAGAAGQGGYIYIWW